MSSEAKHVPPSRTPEGRLKHHQKERTDMTGRMCTCGRKAYRWKHGYVCERCDKIEESGRTTRMNGQEARRNHDIIECAETYTVHLHYVAS